MPDVLPWKYKYVCFVHLLFLCISNLNVEPSNPYSARINLSWFPSCSVKWGKINDLEEFPPLFQRHAVIGQDVLVNRASSGKSQMNVEPLFGSWRPHCGKCWLSLLASLAAFVNAHCFAIELLFSVSPPLTSLAVDFFAQWEKISHFTSLPLPQAWK